MCLLLCTQATKEGRSFLTSPALSTTGMCQAYMHCKGCSPCCFPRGMCTQASRRSRIFPGLPSKTPLEPCSGWNSNFSSSFPFQKHLLYPYLSLFASCCSSLANNWLCRPFFFFRLYRSHHLPSSFCAVVSFQGPWLLRDFASVCLSLLLCLKSKIL